MGTIVAICISDKKGIGKTGIDKVNLIEDFGLEKDAHGGKWHRQVSLLAKEKIDEFIARGGQVKYGDFGENLVTEGLDLEKLNIGDRLILGEAVLEITQKGKECHSKCNIYRMVGDCIMPRNGVFARVIKGGEIEVRGVIRVR